MNQAGAILGAVNKRRWHRRLPKFETGISMTSESRITVESGKMGGAPCIRGLRIPVATVLASLDAGMSREEVLADHPDLESEDITAALNWRRCGGCTCYPGDPGPPPGETWRDLVALDGSDDAEHAAVVQHAAEAALAAGIEPGIRRARWIDGYVRGWWSALARGRTFTPWRRR